MVKAIVLHFCGLRIEGCIVERALSTFLVERFDHFRRTVWYQSFQEQMLALVNVSFVLV